MRRLLASIFSAQLAWYVAKAMGVPWWRDWDAGDGFDMAFMAFFAVYWAIGSARKADR